MTTKTIAQQVFDRQLNYIEEDALEALSIALGWGEEWYKLNPPPFYDMGYDYYDESFEVFGITDPSWIPTKEQLQACWDLGFKHCWFNYNDGTERHCYGTSIEDKKSNNGRKIYDGDSPEFENYRLKKRILELETKLEDIKKFNG